MQIEYLETAALKPYGRNARKHGKKDIAAIVQSIKEFGFNDPIGVWGEKNLIVEGHGRLQAAKRLGMEKVPVIHLDHLTDEQRRAYTLAHNKTAELSDWDIGILQEELGDIIDIDMSSFGFDIDAIDEMEAEEPDDRHPSCQHNVFENQEMMQFPSSSFYGIPQIAPTQTVGNKMIRFMDWKECDHPEEYIAHFFYDDYKFMNAWREPEKYLSRLKRFKAVVSPDFSVYTDFPRALQILACYRRAWCGAYWQSQGIDVIPDVRWGDHGSYDYCFDGMPKGGTVAVSTVGIRNDTDWNNKEKSLFKDGFDEMMKRLKPKTIIFYGSMIDGLEGNIIRVPSYYEEKMGKKKKG